MGVKDTVTTNYLRQSPVFADAFNFFLYGGKQVIDPDSLAELDTKEIGVPYGGAHGAARPVQKIRDVVKSVTAKTDRQTAYLILAIEAQSHIHYAMPVKNMVYDALNYAKQVQAAADSHKKSGDYRHADSGEYLSGFLKTDRLMPVVTLTIYFGASPWSGPTSLHEMFEKQDAQLLSLIPDYRINLLAPAAIPDRDFCRFQSSLRQVLSLIKYSDDADRFAALLRSDDGLKHLDCGAAAVISEFTGADLTKYGNTGQKRSAKSRRTNKKEEIDMPNAIEMMKQAAVKEAVEKATKENTEKVTRQVTASTSVNLIRNLMDSLKMTAEQAMDSLKIPAVQRPQYLQELNR